MSSPTLSEDVFEHVPVRRMSLQPGDIVVLRFDDPRLDVDRVEEFRRAAQERFPGHEILLLNGCDLEVRRPE
jgi:hypothetical protein